MAIEIEKKFLVKDQRFKEGARSMLFQQGYLCPGTGITVRVRIGGERAFLTIKGGHKGISRSEFEYEIPVTDAKEMIKTMCAGRIIEKTRYFLEYEGNTWEIDEFYGNNEGLVMAEIELHSEDQEFIRPPWLGREVSHDRRYYNAHLVTHPYQNWGAEEEAP